MNVSARKQIDMLLPELTLPDIADLIKVNFLLANLTSDIHKLLILLVIKKLSVYYRYTFFDLSDPKVELIHLPIWMGGLADLTTKSLFGGLLACISGKTQYLDKPPPNVVAFHRICKESSFPEWYYKTEKMIEHIPDDNSSRNSDELARHYMDLCREAIKKVSIRI